MQHTDKTSSIENIRPSASQPTRRIRGSQLLIAALAALGAGLSASLVVVVLMGVLRLAAGIPTPVELFGDHVLKLLSAGTFVQLLIKFAPNSKTGPLGLTLLGMIGVGTMLGLLYAAVARVIPPIKGYRPGRREWLTAAVLAVVMTLVAIVLFWGEIGQNFLGLPLGWAMLVTALSLLADFSLYGLTLCLTYRALLPKQVAPKGSVVAQSRRQLLGRAGVAALSIGGGAGTLGLIRGYLNNYASYDGMTK
jgi:hypothetical protein